MKEQLQDLATRLLVVEQAAARQGQIVEILVRDTKKHASAAVVADLEQLTRGQIVPDVAILKHRMDTNQNQSWITQIGTAIKEIVTVIMAGSPQKMLALVLVIVAVGVFVAVGILAVKGTLDDVVRSLKPGNTLVDIPREATSAVDEAVEAVEAEIDSTQ